jgi:hypothetical protein
MAPHAIEIARIGLANGIRGLALARDIINALSRWPATANTVPTSSRLIREPDKNASRAASVREGCRVRAARAIT